MGTEERRAISSLIEGLVGGEPGFEFPQAALLLRRLRREVPGTAVRLGAGPQRYGVDRGAAFAAWEARWREREARRGGEAEPEPRLEVSFLALAGAMGPLPAAYAELAWVREREGDHALSDFLEIFESRIVELFLLAHVRNRPWLQFAWLRGGPSAPGEARVSWGDRRGLPFEDAVFALIGAAVPDVRERVGVPPHALLYYAGLLAQAPCSASALSTLLSDFLGVPVVVDGFQGRWIDLPAGAGSRLGFARGARLGDDLMLGERFFDPSTGFRLVLGPLDWAAFRELLPDRPGSVALARLASFAAGAELEFDFELALRAEDVPEARLTTEQEARQRLGWSTWISSGDRPRRVRSGPHRREALDPTRDEAAATRTGGERWT